MTNQEKPAPGYESSLPQKPANLDSKVPIQMAHECDAKPADGTTGGYYLNVAQKGKLILPTALWILLIIAGVSFITLLATLNKSINTLETLVEIEQENKALSYVEHLQRHKSGREPERYLKKSTAKPKKSSKKDEKHNMKLLPNQADMIQVFDLNEPQADGGWFLPIEPSWFAMPSWTSLEPVRQQAPPPPPMPSIGSLEEMMRGQPGAPDTIIIRDGPLEQPPSGLLDSFMKQLAPVLDRLIPAGSGDVSGTLSITDQGESPATISAKIDNLSVHINPESRKPTSRQEELNSWEKSIDELADKLMAPPQPMPPKGPPHHRLRPKRPHESVLGSIFASPVELPPFQRPESGPDAVFLQISSSIDGSQPFGENKLKKLGSPAEGLPDDQLVISFPGGLGPIRPSGETNRHQLSNTRRPLASHSPYEQQSQFPSDILLLNQFMKPEPRPMPHHRHRPDHHIVKPGKPADAPWDILANELAEGLIEDVFKQQNKRPDRIGTPNEPQLVIIDDGTPLALGEQPNVIQTVFRPENLMPTFELPSLDGSHKSSEKPQNVGDMFNMLFEPTPDSRPMVGEPKQSEESNQSASSTPQVDSTIVINLNESATTKVPTTDAPTSANSQPASDEIKLTTSSMEPTMSSEAKKKVDSIISQLHKEISSPGEIENKAPDEFLQDFMRPLFTLPQMSGNQQSASTNGSRPAAGSSDVSTQPTTTSTTPSITTTNLPVSTTPIPGAANATTPSGESRVNSILSKVIGFFRDQRPANQIEEPKTTTANAGTTPMPKSEENATKLTTSVASEPIVEVIEEQEALDQLPAIDLSLFAKSSKPFDRVSEKSSDLEKVASSPTTSEPQPSSVGLAQNTPTTSITTTSKPKLVTVSQADLEAETQKSKSFLQKANDVLERQILGIKRFLNADKS